MDINELLSVSSGDSSEIISTDILTVSGGDNDMYVTNEQFSIFQEELANALSTEEVITIWEKPLAEYNTQETLLLFIFALLLWLVISRFIGGIFK